MLRHLFKSFTGGDAGWADPPPNPLFSTRFSPYPYPSSRLHPSSSAIKVSIFLAVSLRWWLFHPLSRYFSKAAGPLYSLYRRLGPFVSLCIVFSILCLLLLTVEDSNLFSIFLVVILDLVLGILRCVFSSEGYQLFQPKTYTFLTMGIS